MYQKKLVDHVTAKLREGVPQDKIHSDLISNGWSVEDVKDAFYYSEYPEEINRFSFKRALQSTIPTKVTVLIMFIMSLSFAASFYIFKSTTKSFNITIPSIAGASDTQFTYGALPSLSDPDYFSKVKNQFVDNKADFVEADLSSMKLRVYKKGEMTLEVPIDSKGREGSWWETPAGIYQITNKEDRHFSGMGHVWMPWSMKFQGNFYIHGRTYYPDGTLTSAEFTGGCIRLLTEDAEKVYRSINIGIPLLVFEHSFNSDAFKYKNDEGPALSAPIYIAADIKNNHVFATKNATSQAAIASITKLMTVLVATEYINLDNVARVTKESLIYTSKPRFQEGQEYSIYHLLFPLLQESSNEAAEVIARYYGRADFIKHMNEKAVSIGMANSKFVDPSGASAENVSTAEDLFKLAKYIYINRSFIFNITSGKLKNSAYGSQGFSDLQNFNTFKENEYFFGGKDGKTRAAGETNISVFEFPVNIPNNTTKRPIVLIILGSTDIKTESQKLLDYTLNHFHW